MAEHISSYLLEHQLLRGPNPNESLAPIEQTESRPRYE